MLALSPHTFHIRSLLLHLYSKGIEQSIVMSNENTDTKREEEKEANSATDRLEHDALVLTRDWCQRFRISTLRARQEHQDLSPRLGVRLQSGLFHLGCSGLVRV